MISSCASNTSIPIPLLTSSGGGTAGGVNTPHNGLQGIQGGLSNERYHLTQIQYQAVAGASTASSSNIFATIADLPPTVNTSLYAQLNYVNTNFALFERIANKNIAGGYAGIASNGKINSAFLPSYVDTIEEYTTGTFPNPGVTGTIYVNTDNNLTYRWSGSQYIEISPSPGTTDGLAEGSTNLYFSAARVTSVTDILYQPKLPNGANGQILSLVNGAPSWIAPPTTTTPTTNIMHTATYTASGNGSNIIVTIPHGFVDITTTSRIFVTPTGTSVDARDFTRAGVDNVNIYIYYDVAPPLGTNNLIYNVLLDSTIDPAAKKSGSYATSGNNTSTTIQIVHGFSGVTSADQVFVTATTDDASGFLSATLDTTKVYIHYDVAPILGVNNLTYDILVI
jgi:hypothetical protein